MFKPFERLKAPSVFVCAVLVVGAVTPAKADTSNLGLVSVKSVHNVYLQAHQDNGELHASNGNRGSEETWFLFQVDPANHIYALANYSNGAFMSKAGGNVCAPAKAAVIGTSEEWQLVNGGQYGVANAFALKNVADGTFLGDGGGPGIKDPSCGGEVAAHSNGMPPTGDSTWPGWWVISGTTKPDGGPSFSDIMGIANSLIQVAGAVVVAL